MDLIKNKFRIIVSRYNEDLSWLIPFKDIAIVYNKGPFHHTLNNFNVINLPNFGRESNTYLNYIIENYNNLADYNIFFQGKISDHSPLYIEDYFKENEFNGYIRYIDINILKKPIKHFGKWKDQRNNNNMRLSNLTVYDWLEKFVELKIDHYSDVGVVWGANFSVSKKIIQDKPIEFYKYLLRFVNYHYNPEEGHFFERSWNLILNNKINLKKKIGYININNNNINLNLINKIIKSNNFEDFHIWVNNNFNDDKLKFNHIPQNIYIKLNNEIINNSFDFIINFNSTFFIKIIYNDDNYYELVLNLSNNESILYLNKNVLNKTKDFIFKKGIDYKLNFEFNNNLIIKINDNEFYNNINKFKDLKIKYNYIKFLNNENEIKYNGSKNKYKYFMKDYNNFNIDYFYNYNYLNYYIDEIDLLNYI